MAVEEEPRRSRIQQKDTQHHLPCSPAHSTAGETGPAGI